MLTKHDLTGLRDCDHVSLVWNPEKYENGILRMSRSVSLERDGAERTVAQLAKSEVWSRSYVGAYSIDYDRVVECDLAARISSYVGTAQSAYCPIYSDGAWSTIVSLLRVGDELGLRFVGANDSENMRSVRYHRDECYLIVKRGEKHMTFLVDVQVGPNNTARMVQTV
jgi:hypothetical protein